MIKLVGVWSFLLDYHFRWFSTIKLPEGESFRNLLESTGDTLWLFNIAMENDPFTYMIYDLPIILMSFWWWFSSSPTVELSEGNSEDFWYKNIMYIGLSIASERYPEAGMMCAWEPKPPDFPESFLGLSENKVPHVPPNLTLYGSLYHHFSDTLAINWWLISTFQRPMSDRPSHRSLQLEPCSSFGWAHGHTYGGPPYPNSRRVYISPGLYFCLKKTTAPHPEEEIPSSFQEVGDDVGHCSGSP